MQKAKSITLRNFKYFYGHEDQYPQNKLELDGNNLLLYGENGSGKSSIYWALYTFLQSCLKEEQVDIEKYFDPAHAQNLRNRFAAENDESGIVVEFTAPSGDTIKELKRNSDATYNINTFRDAFVQRAIEGSDFINYKYLSKLYDFRNSEPIDLFPLFVKEILMFVNFEVGYYQHDGTTSPNTYASQWWDFICDAPNQLPYTGKIVRVSSDEYKRFKRATIPRFVELLKGVLTDVAQRANTILENDFKEPFSISFDTDSITCDYNKNISKRAKDGKIHNPKIPLHVEFNHDHFDDGQESIQKPHTFLNEARLTAIALAIRFAILERRPELPNSARLLILDDLLLSLDMSHRDKVLDIILSPNFIETYQLLIFTHDRAFFNMCRNRINDRFKTGWVFREMYQDENEAGIPIPFVPDIQNYLDRAKKYLKEFDYPACANYLRKETERVLAKVLLPKNMTVRVSDDQGSKPLQLDDLIKNFLKYFKEIGGNVEPYEKLLEHKDLLLNPLSHDNTESPIYKLELQNVTKLLETLNRLEARVIGIPDLEDEQPFTLNEKDENGEDWEFTIILKETFRAIKDLDNSWKISNPVCHFISRKNVTQNLPVENLGNTMKLQKGHDQIRHALKIKESEDPKDLRQIIEVDGLSLIDMLNE